MYVTNVCSTKFGGLIPKQEYKGVILKLTPKDKGKIDTLLSEKAELILELSLIERLLSEKRGIIESSGLDYWWTKVDARIQEIEKQIKEIKVSRLEKQKKRVKSSD